MKICDFDIAFIIITLVLCFLSREPPVTVVSLVKMVWLVSR